jgi:hypothetical protein
MLNTLGKRSLEQKLFAMSLHSCLKLRKFHNKGYDLVIDEKMLAACPCKLPFK